MVDARQVPDKFHVAFSFADEQRGLVRDIAIAVEGILGRGTVFLDEWYQHYIAGADADIALQDIYGKLSELVVVCVSEHYGGKLWPLAEYEAIRARTMLARRHLDKREHARILHIRVAEGELRGLQPTTIVTDVRGMSVADAANLIVARLQFVAGVAEARSADSHADPWLPEAPSSLEWPMADHSPVRDALAALMTRGAPWRLLTIRGPSETGKSHITRQVLANALRISELACGRLDFKGGIDMEDEVRAFVQNLDVPLPTSTSLINERLGKVLDALFTRRRPTLLIFDTYEDVARPQQDWMENELLVRLLRAAWLRVVVAGQRVPERRGAIWSSVSGPVLDLRPPSPSEWFDYGRQHHPDLKLEFVEECCRVTNGKVSLLAQVLGPAI